MMADLHCHSYYSDGSYSPQNLVNKAIAAGISLLALTDHDTVEGIEELRNSSELSNLTIINGIELSTRWKKYDIHILGLNINITNNDLMELITQQNNSRLERSYRIADCITQLGIDDVIGKARVIAGHDRLARPHFAQLLVNEGKVHDRQTAFKRYLTPGKMAYVTTEWISVVEAINVIKVAGGHAVLAHPLKYRLTRTKLNQLIAYFKENDGDALEVISGESNASDIQQMIQACEHFQLMSSTGSDYHGDLSRVSLGRQYQLPVNCTPIWNHWSI